MYVSVKIALCVVVFLQEGITALIWAAYRGHQAIVEMLLAAGANTDMQDEVSTL